jgi:hypothetical protein
VEGSEHLSFPKRVFMLLLKRPIPNPNPAPMGPPILPKSKNIDVLLNFNVHNTFATINL